MSENAMTENAMTENAIVAQQVTVRYGRKPAVHDVSLAVANGSVYALLGRNGAGKSSLVRAILGLLRPAEGHVSILGRDVWKERASLMDRLGVVPEDPDAPPEMRVRDLAWFGSRLYSRWNQQAFDERIDRFAIASAVRHGDLSKGQKKQVSLAMALATSPELLILDDPTLGLDVVARKSFFEEVIADLSDRGLTVLITTHDLSAVETIADRVGILEGGQLVLDEELETLKSRFRRIRFAGPPVALEEAKLAAAMVRPWGSGTEAVATNYDEPALERLRRQTRTADAAPLTLEEIFVATVGEETK